MPQQSSSLTLFLCTTASAIAASRAAAFSGELSRYRLTRSPRSTRSKSELPPLSPLPKACTSRRYPDRVFRVSSDMVAVTSEKNPSTASLTACILLRSSTAKELVSLSSCSSITLLLNAKLPSTIFCAVSREVAFSMPLSHP